VLYEYLARNLSIYDIFASGETTDYYLVLVMFLAMLYLKHMCTDHSCIENSDVETKHLIFETISLTKTKYNWKSPTPPDRLTAHRSALANLIITYIYTYTEHSIALVVNQGY